MEDLFMEIFKNKGFILLTKIMVVILLGSLLVGIISIAILSSPAKFSDTYQSVIQRKYDLLKNTDDKKIIIVGGSNAAFGIVDEYLEEETGYSVVNMGLHAGFGALFPTELVKDYINEEDIVLLAYEYELSSSSFEKLGDIDLIMSGIDNALEIYKKIPLRNIPEILGNLFDFAKSKATKVELTSGTYSSNSFDEAGRMVLERKTNTMMDYKSNLELYKEVTSESLYAAEDDYEYLVDLRVLVEKRGAEIYFVAPVLMEDAYVGTEEALLAYQEGLMKKTGIEYISNAKEYMFPSEYIYDTIYHCNEMGAQKRTELLLSDLQSHGILKNVY